MSAEIISLCEKRASVSDVPVVDLRTAVDVAIRDLREIQTLLGTQAAPRRLSECEQLLRAALAHA